MSKNIYNFMETFTPSNDLQKDIYQILKLELGKLCEDSYEDIMDGYALSTTKSAQEFYENYYHVLRKLKTVLKNDKILSLQDYINTKRNDLKDGFLSPKEQNQTTTSLDLLDKWNKNILQLVYDVMEEVKANIIKRHLTCYEVLDKYFDLNIQKKYASMEDFLNKNYEILEKSIHLVYGGYNYGKK